MPRANPKKGLKPSERKLATTSKAIANQWQNTPQQSDFMARWLDPQSVTFGNAYKSAIASGFKESYAVQIASPAVSNQWIQEYTKRLNLTEEHIKQGITNLALNTFDNRDSRSPADTRLKAFETLARVTGVLDNKNTTNVTLVQPILNGNSVIKATEINTQPTPQDSHIEEGELIPE